jgi:predicted nucleic acid-binding Zn ribbon protein
VSRRWAQPDRVPRPSPASDYDGSQTETDPTVPIGAAVDRLLRQRGMEDALVLGRVASCWEDVVGPEVARQVRPQLVRAGELVVSADHPAWATELELASPAILERLAKELGDMAPKRLRVRVAPGSPR